MKNNRIKSLDGLRGIFSVVVMAGHFSLFAHGFQSNEFKNVALAVQFFFILSGLALCYGMEQKFITGKLSVGRFAIQRLARLYPLHIISMIAAGIFIWPLLGTLSPSGQLAWDTIANLLLAQSIGITKNWSWNVVSWSISTEFWVGLVVLPFAIRRLSALASLSLAILGYASIYITLQTIRHQYDSVIHGLISAVVSTTSGMLLGVALCRWLPVLPAIHTKFKSFALGIVELACLCLILEVIYVGTLGYFEVMALVPMPFLIYSAATSRSWFVSVLESRLLTLLGDISYSLYLLHVPILGALYMIRLGEIENLWVRFAIFFAVTSAISYISFRLIERPLYRRLRYLGCGQAASGQMA